MTIELNIPEFKVPVCDKCRSEKLWRDCHQCDEGGFMDHDCGEDTCCCLDPEPNIYCDTCNGETGWFQCASCFPWGD